MSLFPHKMVVPGIRQPLSASQRHLFSLPGRWTGGSHISHGAIGACRPTPFHLWNRSLKQYQLLLTRQSHGIASCAENIQLIHSQETTAMEIEIISKEVVKPASATPLHLRTFKLSLIDQLARHEYSNLVYFFSPVNQNQSTMLNDVISKRRQRLKQSLSRTLVPFYPLAGKVKDNLHIDCNDDGVYFTEARVSIRLSDFLKEPENELINRLFAFNPSSAEIMSQTYLVVVQVNIFACGGIAVGLSTSHKIVDGITMSTFLNAWAATARESSEQINPIFVSSSLFHQVPRYTSNYSKLITGMSRVLSKRQLDEHNYVTKRFFFDRLALDALKTKAATSSLYPTSVKAVIGLLWKSSIAAVRSGTQKKSSLLIPVDLRTRCSPRLHRRSFGNIVWLAHTQQGAESSPELQLLVNCITNAIANINTGFVEGMKGEGGYRNLMETLKNFEELICNPNSAAEVFMISSLCKAGFPEVDFGWGKPVWFFTCRGSRNIYGYRAELNAWLMDTKSDDGIEAWVHLKKDDMAIFEKNPELLAFASLNPSPLES